MKVRKKRKEAEREGEASATMVSQGALPAPSLFEGAFWGRGQLLRGSRDLPLLTHLKKERDREGTGRERGSRGDLACVLSAAWKTARCSALCLLITGELDRPPLLFSSPPGILFFLPPYSLLSSRHPSVWCARHRPDSGRNCCIRYLQCLHLLVCFDFFFFLLCYLRQLHLALSSEWDGCPWG